MKTTLLFSLLLMALPLAAQTCDKSSLPLTRYRLNGDVALDVQTGLSWRRCAEGQSWTGKQCKGEPRAMSMSDAKSWVERLNQGPAPARSNAKGWRLPTQDELLTLIDPGCSDPAVNLKAFPGTASRAFWTGTSAGGTGFWSVNFSDGFEEIFNGNRPLPIRLVRK